MTNPILNAINVGKYYNFNGNKISILQNLNLTINAGDFNILMGPSGSGKTTLLNICGMLDEVTSGLLTINNQEVAKLSNLKKTQLRGSLIGFIFQFHNLLPDFTALENVALPLLINKVNKKLAIQQALDMLNSVGLHARAKHYPSMLSGGEQQRVAIARALISKPKLLIADEPTGNLDKKTASEILELMLNLAKINNTAMLVATHDINLTKLTSHYLTLNSGVLQQVYS